MDISLPVWIALVWAMVLALAVASGGTFGVQNEWVWAQREDLSFPLTTLLITLLCLGGLVFIVWWAAKQKSVWDNSPQRYIVGALLLAIGLRLCFAGLQPQNWQPVSAFWALVIASPVSTSFFIEAREVERKGISNYLRHYHETLSAKPFHAATHPPGLAVFFYSLRAVAKLSAMKRLATYVFDDEMAKELQGLHEQVMRGFVMERGLHRIAIWELRSAWWIAIFLILCNVVAFLLLAWLLWLTVSNGSYLVAIALVATTPAMLWWIPAVDSLHLLILVLVLMSATMWDKFQKQPPTLLTKTGTWSCAFLTGFLGGYALWFAFKNAIPISCLLLWLLWSFATQRERKDWWLVSAQLAMAVALCALPFALNWLAHGFNLIATLKAASQAHAIQAGHHARSYLPWVVMNPADFAMGMGGAWLGLVIAYLWHWWRNERWRPSLTVTTLIVLLLLNFSGVVRGETARLWLPFIPLLTLETVRHLPNRLTEVALLIAVQGGMALALHLWLEFLRPW